MTKARTAYPYETNAGEYFHIIDVEGRECSGFQRFDTEKLGKDLERCLCANSTPHVVDTAIPMRGLPSKFHNQDFEPLVEVIHDTCGMQ